MHVRVPAEVVAREIDGEAVLLNLATGIYFGLNSTGTRIWRALVENGSPQDAIRALLREYEVAGDQLQRDVSRLVEELVSKGLLLVDREGPEGR